MKTLFEDSRQVARGMRGTNGMADNGTIAHESQRVLSAMFCLGLLLVADALSCTKNEDTDST